MLDLFRDPFWLVPFSVFLGGLLGSPHCVSMCGPLVINFASSKRLLVFYQAGRLLSYSLAGALVGAFGESIFGSARPQWFTQTSLALIAVILLFNAYVIFSGKQMHFPLPRFLGKLSNSTWRSIYSSKLPRPLLSGSAGFLTVLLPCGHLYSFLIGAVATGSALKGAVFMFAFWLGSTPLLSFGASWLQKILNSKLVSTRRWAGLLIFMAGIFSLISFAYRTEVFTKHQHQAYSQSSEKSAENCH